MPGVDFGLEATVVVSESYPWVDFAMAFLHGGLKAPCRAET